MTQSDAPPRGAFIVFEGADRAGKSTQCAMLVDHLKSQGIDAELWNFPDRTTAIGKMINSYLTSKSDIDDAAVHLLFSANRWEKRETLLNKLAAGTTLVVDRAEAAAARGGFGEERYERPAFQEAVLKQFEALQGPEWKVVDASRGIDEIQNELREAASEVVSKCKAGGVPVPHLWA
ncbi:hypothetical protein Ndes2437B_g00472 [Nannochloris sp. 'desiccata']